MQLFNYLFHSLSCLGADQHLGGRKQACALTIFNSSLGKRVKIRHSVNFVTEKLNSYGICALLREEIHYTATLGVLSLAFHRLDSGKAEGGKSVGQLLGGDYIAYGQRKRGFFQHFHGNCVNCGCRRGRNHRLAAVIHYRRKHR